MKALEGVGVTGPTLDCYGDFLTGWRQVVKFNGELSESKVIRRGIIQGENNSQLLFSVFINNITKYIKNCRVLLYVDDVQLYIESDVRNLNDWGNEC